MQQKVSVSSPLGCPSITVGIPAYNARMTLARAIESVLNQTTSVPVETLIVDDGSTDTTANIARGYEFRFPGRVRLLRTSNCGVAAARNKIVNEARGFYLTWLDADDMYFPAKLQGQLDHIEVVEQSLMGLEHHVLVFCNFFIGDKVYSVDGFLDVPIKNVLKGDLRAYLWATLTQTVNYKRIGPFNERLHRCEDTDWLLRYLKSGSEIFASASALPQMRYHFSTERNGQHVEEAFLYLREAYKAEIEEYAIAKEWVPRRYWEISNFYRTEKKWDDMWRCRTMAAKLAFDIYFPRIISELSYEMRARDEKLKDEILKEVGRVAQG